MSARGTKGVHRRTSGQAAPLASAGAGNTTRTRPGSMHAVARDADPQKRGRSAGGAEAEDAFTPAAFVHLTGEHCTQLRQAFDMFDSAGTGRIKASEVRVAFFALGYPVNSLELHRALRDAGVATEVGPDGAEPTMDFSDFYNVLLRRMTEKEMRSESVRAFRQMDQDGKGYISLDDLRGIANSLHMELTTDELVEMLAFAQSATAAGPGAVPADLVTRESLAVSEEQFLKLLKRANVY